MENNKTVVQPRKVHTSWDWEDLWRVPQLSTEQEKGAQKEDISELAAYDIIYVLSKPDFKYARQPVIH